MNILLIFACLILPVAFAIGLHNSIAHFVMPHVMRSKISRALYFVSAFIGVPIHELSHAFFAILFRHKIDKISLFQVGADGRLGYVMHRWNTHSIYQTTGLFFIAIAPLFGAGFVTFLMCYSFNIPLSHFNYISPDSTISDMIVIIGGNFNVLIDSIMTDSRGLTWFCVMSLVCFHCIPSRSDFKHAVKGSLIVLAIVSLFLFTFELFMLNNMSHTVFTLWSISITMLILVSISSLFWWFVLATSSLFLRY